jgi:hypothetical protein
MSLLANAQKVLDYLNGTTPPIMRAPKSQTKVVRTKCNFSKNGPTVGISRDLKQDASQMQRARSVWAYESLRKDDA